MHVFQIHLYDTLKHVKVNKGLEHLKKANSDCHLSIQQY